LYATELFVNTLELSFQSPPYKTRDETCRAYRTARRDTCVRHVFRGIATAWTGVDMCC